MTKQTPLITHLQTNGGNPAPNQLVVDSGDYQVFLSYGEVIAIRLRLAQNTSIHINREYWDYSQTTLKYLKKFLVTRNTKKQMALEFETDRNFTLVSDKTMKDHYNKLLGA